MDNGYYPAGTYDDPRAPWNCSINDEDEEDLSDYIDTDDYDKEDYLCSKDGEEDA